MIIVITLFIFNVSFKFSTEKEDSNEEEYGKDGADNSPGSGGGNF